MLRIVNHRREILYFTSNCSHFPWTSPFFSLPIPGLGDLSQKVCERSKNTCNETDKEEEPLPAQFCFVGYIFRITNLCFFGTDFQLSDFMLTLSDGFFVKATSFEAREAHRYKNNRLGIFRARGGGLLDHPYDPRHPLSTPPTGERQGVNSQAACIR